MNTSLLAEIALAQKKHPDITIESLSDATQPAIIEHAPPHKITLNKPFAELTKAHFDEARMIAVLYHELGHAIYFRQKPSPPANRNELADSEASEYAAFENSLKETIRLKESGDPEPLQRALYYIDCRARSGIERADYRAALDSLLRSDLWSRASTLVSPAPAP